MRNLRSILFWTACFVLLPLALWFTAWKGIDFATPPSIDEHL